MHKSFSAPLKSSNLGAIPPDHVFMKASPSFPNTDNSKVFVLLEDITGKKIIQPAAMAKRIAPIIETIASALNFFFTVTLFINTAS